MQTISLEELCAVTGGNQQIPGTNVERLGAESVAIPGTGMSRTVTGFGYVVPGTGMRRNPTVRTGIIPGTGMRRLP